MNFTHWFSGSSSRCPKTYAVAKRWRVCKTDKTNIESVPTKKTGFNLDKTTCSCHGKNAPGMRRPELPPEVVMERTGRDPDQYSQPYRNILLSFTCYIHLFTQFRRTAVCELIQRCVILTMTTV